MQQLTAIAAVAVMTLGAQGVAFGYSATASVIVNFGGNSSSAAGADPSNTNLYDATADIGWTSNGNNSLAAMSNSTYFTTQSGYNSNSYYNPDFAQPAQCTLVVPATGAVGSTRKYGCRYTNATGAAAFIGTPVTDAGPIGQASGTLTVTNTSLSGTLTLVSTTDEPTGGTVSSVGNGLNGYNYRTADGSPFGNVWYGLTTSGTFQVNLFGTFTASAWTINGGGVKFTDTGFLCQQGGNSTPSNILCSVSTQPGGYQTNGAHLSWGWDADGSGTGTTAVTEIEVRDATGTTVVASLSGVLATLAINGSGTITTSSGEFRRGLGGSACGGPFMKWDGTRLSCGTFSVGKVNITGVATQASAVPIPAAVWLFGSAVGLLAGVRRRMAV